MNKSVNRSQLAELCGVNLSTVDNWVRDGCPFISRPVRQGVGRWEFSVAAVFEWRINRERQAVLGDVVTIDENEARRRKLAAEAGLAELELHMANGAAVAIKDQEKIWVQMVGAARAKLLSLPTKLCRLVAIEVEPAACQALMEDGISEALGELAGFEPAEHFEAEELNDDAVDARMAEVAATITKIRNAAASGGPKQLAAIIAECDRARSSIFGISVESGGTSQPGGVHSADGVDLGATAKVDDKPVGRSRPKTQSRSK